MNRNGRTHFAVVPSRYDVLPVWRVSQRGHVVEVPLLLEDVRLALPLPHQQLTHPWKDTQRPQNPQNTIKTRISLFTSVEMENHYNSRNVEGETDFLPEHPKPIQSPELFMATEAILWSEILEGKTFRQSNKVHVLIPIFTFVS